MIEVPGGTLGPASLGLELVDGGGEETLGTVGLSTVGFFFSLDNSLILLVLISWSESESSSDEESSSSLWLTSLIIALISSLL